MTENKSTTFEDAEARLRAATKQFEQARASNCVEQTEITKKAMEQAFNELARHRK